MTGPDGMPAAEPVLRWAVTCYVEASDAATVLDVAGDMFAEPGGAGMLAAVGVLKVRRAQPGESVLG